MRFDITIDKEAARQIAMKYIAEKMILLKNHYLTLNQNDKLILSKQMLLHIAPEIELKTFVERFNQEVPTDVSWDNI